MKRIGDGKVGLALGGGAVLGAAHIGVVRALAERDIAVECISGTSIGAVMAALYAFGKEWRAMRDIAVELDWLDLTGLSVSRYGLLSNAKIGRMITEELGDVTFADAVVPLAVVATDIARGEKVVLREGRVSDAVMASTCIPGIFVPINQEERMLVDGGIMENVPLSCLERMGADYTVGVDLNARQTFEKPGNLVEVLLNTVNLTLQQASRLQTEKADLPIEPDVAGFNLYDIGQVPELIERGYRAAGEALDGVLSESGD